MRYETPFESLFSKNNIVSNQKTNMNPYNKSNKPYPGGTPNTSVGGMNNPIQKMSNGNP